MTDFAALTEPFRGELLAHCYRLLGSRDDAEDAVQDTYVRAWRGFTRFEGRSSIRRWLYTIATRVCLTALEHRGRRPLPSGLGPPTGDPNAEVGATRTEIDWLQPMPDALLRQENGDPAGVVAARAGIRLAFVAALQHLPARQRAALILCDVLGWPAGSAATMLETGVPAVNSALQRARVRLRTLGLASDDVAEPDDAGTRAVLDRYADAFARADIAPLVAMMRADVQLEMPPVATWFTGRDAVAGFFAARVLGRPGHWRLSPTWANTQPALFAHERAEDGTFRPHGLTVLTLRDRHIVRITAFNDLPTARIVPAAC